MRRALILLPLLLSACLPVRRPLPVSTAIHLMVANQYARFMWSVYSPATALAAAPDRILAQGPLGLAAFDTYTSGAAWTDNSGSSGELFAHNMTAYRTFYDGLEAYDTQDGRVIWETGALYSGNARRISSNDGNIFLTDQANRLLVLDMNGRLLSSADLSSSSYTPLAEQGGVLLYISGDDLVSQDVNSGGQLWATRLPGIRQALLGDNMMYALAEPSAQSFAVFGVDTRSGKIVWKWDGGVDVISNLCMLGPDIFLLTADGRLVILSSVTGRQITALAFTNTPFVLHRTGPPVTAYRLAGDPANHVLAIAFGDTYQLMALELTGPPEVLIEKPLER